MSAENPFSGPSQEAMEAPETKLEHGPEVTKFKELVALFETEHSLAELHLIINLSSEDAPNHPIREPARKAIAPIVSQLKKLKEETNISTEQYEVLRAEYKRLSRAVGIINKGMVDHTR